MYEFTFTTTSNEIFVDSTKARVDHVKSLSDASEFPDQCLIFNVPKIYALKKQASQLISWQTWHLKAQENGLESHEFQKLTTALARTSDCENTAL